MPLGLSVPFLPQTVSTLGTAPLKNHFSLRQTGSLVQFELLCLSSWVLLPMSFGKKAQAKSDVSRLGYTDSSLFSILFGLLFSLDCNHRSGHLLRSLLYGSRSYLLYFYLLVFQKLQPGFSCRIFSG